MAAPALPPERHELHNAAIDEEIAAAGACAQVHLATGRICPLEHGHDGSCDFTPAADAHAIAPVDGKAPAQDA